MNVASNPGLSFVSDDERVHHQRTSFVALAPALRFMAHILFQATMSKLRWARTPVILLVTLVLMIAGVAVAISILGLIVECLHLP
ncbi:MAG TPA: hypothetical protein VGL08_09155 [Paraburkholderia sp.]|jgi:hypothetical protein